MKTSFFPDSGIPEQPTSTPRVSGKKYLGIGLFFGFAIGGLVFSLGQSDSTEPSGSLEASEQLLLPSRSEADRFWQVFPLPKGQGQIYVHVLGGASESVNIVLLEVNQVAGLLSVHRRTLQRKMQSFESVFIWLASGRKCSIIPDTSWGGVHRDTGLEVKMEITDD